VAGLAVSLAAAPAVCMPAGQRLATVGTTATAKATAQHHCVGTANLAAPSCLWRWGQLACLTLHCWPLVSTRPNLCELGSMPVFCQSYSLLRCSPAGVTKHATYVRQRSCISCSVVAHWSRPVQQAVTRPACWQYVVHHTSPRAAVHPCSCGHPPGSNDWWLCTYILCVCWSSPPALLRKMMVCVLLVAS
jgi:hypothetical protein